MGCHFLLQGIFQTQGSNLPLLCLLHWQGRVLYHLGSPHPPDPALLQSCGEMSCVEPCPDCVTSGLRNSQPLPRGSQPLVLDPWCPLVRAFKCTGGSSHPPGQHSTHRTQAGGETFPFRGSGGQLCSAGPRQHAAPVHHSPSTAGHPWLSFPSSPASLSQDPRLSFPGNFIE